MLNFSFLIAAIVFAIGAIFGGLALWLLRVAPDQRLKDRIAFSSHVVQSLTVIVAIGTFSWQYFSQEAEARRVREQAQRELDRYTIEFVDSIRDEEVRYALQQARGMLVSEFDGMIKLWESTHETIRIDLYNWFNHRYFQTLASYTDMLAVCLQGMNPICNAETAAVLICTDVYDIRQAVKRITPQFVARYSPYPNQVFLEGICRDNGFDFFYYVSRSTNERNVGWYTMKSVLKRYVDESEIVDDLPYWLERVK